MRVRAEFVQKPRYEQMARTLFEERLRDFAENTDPEHAVSLESAIGELLTDWDLFWEDGANPGPQHSTSTLSKTNRTWSGLTIYSNLGFLALVDLTFSP